MSSETLDVSVAILSRMPLERSIHVRALSDGLPGVGEVCPRTLLNILGGAYGLTDLRVIGSTLAAEASVLGNAMDLKPHLRLLVEAIPKGESQGGSGWRSRREI